MAGPATTSTASSTHKPTSSTTLHLHLAQGPSPRQKLKWIRGVLSSLGVGGKRGGSRRTHRQNTHKEEGSNAFHTMTPGPSDMEGQARRRETRKYAAESHNFEQEQSEVWRLHEEQRRKGELFGAHTGRQRAFIRWTLTAAVAILTQLLCVFIIASTTQLELFKFRTVLLLLGHDRWFFTLAAFVVFLTICMVYAAVACLMTLLEPASSGSGIAEVKCFLNGIDVPHFMRVKTLWAKAVGIIFSQASGLPLGFEGPVVHSGAIIGSLFSERFSFEDFRTDKERRDFVVCGTAAGVAAAFGAPIGGVFFAMEEGASYMTLKLTWRCFFCAMVTVLVGYLMLIGLPVEFVSQLYFLDPFPPSKSLYHYKDLGIFVVMGIGGGLLGATFNQLNRYLTVFRLKWITAPKAKMVEVLSLTALMAILSFFVPFAGRCRSRPPLDPTTELFNYASTLRSFQCKGSSSYNELASLYFQSWDDSLRILFHLPMHLETGEPVFTTEALLGFFVPYFVLAFITFGASVPSGLFIPSLLSGAVLGRIVGQALHPFGGFAEPGIYSLVGASAVLGGVTRMTISLALILLEATGNLYLLIPLSLSLFLSRWSGNFFNEGIYDMHIRLHHVPFLEPHCPKEARITDLRVGEIMAMEPQFLRPIEKVSRILDILLANDHHCFPLLEDDHSVFGSISRDALCALLYLKAFATGNAVPDKTSALPQSPIVPYAELERFFPHFPTADIVADALTKEERDTFYIDLRPYCNTAPFFVMEATSVPRAYRLFRSLGLRHLLVLNRKGQLVGVVTRHDLEEEHILASLVHSPMLLGKDVWKMDKSFLPLNANKGTVQVIEKEGVVESLPTSPASSPSMP